MSSIGHYLLRSGNRTFLAPFPVGWFSEVVFLFVIWPNEDITAAIRRADTAFILFSPRFALPLELIEGHGIVAAAVVRVPTAICCATSNSSASARTSRCR